MSFRDTAATLTQHASGNFVDVALYVPAGSELPTPWWDIKRDRGDHVAG